MTNMPSSSAGANATPEPNNMRLYERYRPVRSLKGRARRGDSHEVGRVSRNDAVPLTRSHCSTENMEEGAPQMPNSTGNGSGGEPEVENLTLIVG